MVRKNANLQVLVAAMHQTDHSLLEKMNIQSDAIIVNQCDRYEFEDFDYNGHRINFISFAERGVGLSRNNALMRVSAEICLFADEDVTYVENYKEIVLNSFLEIPDADVIIFNVLSNNQKRPSHVILKRHRVRWFNCLKYGTVRVAARTDKLKMANIYFSLLFGGGAKYSGGEDSLFILECIRKGLKIYADPNIIGHVSQEESSWFEGYTNKFFFDRGVLYAFLSKRWAYLLCMQFVVRHSKLFNQDKSVLEACKLMFSGVKEAKDKWNK